MTSRSLPVKIALSAAVVALLLAVQALLGRYFDEYVQQIVLYAGINIILAVSLNLINGITGQFSLGHAGFMAAGAYSAAAFTFYVGPQITSRFQNESAGSNIVFIIALLLSAAAAGIAGLVVGLPSLRLRGDYLAIVTLGFGQIIIVLITNIREVGGAAGMTGLPLMTNFLWVAVLAVLCVLSVRNLAISHLGRSMKAVREDEVAAEAVGVDTTRAKVLAFVISSMWAGVAGALQAHYIQSAHPGSFTFIRSIEVVIMVVLGGLGSITGAVVTAVLLTGLTEVLRSITGAFAVGMSLVLFAAVLTLPRYRSAMRQSAMGWLLWLRWPLLSGAALMAGFLFGRDWLEARVAALRFVIYALILIVLMLLRPQGLLGRSELSWGSLRRSRSATAPEAEGASERSEPVDEGVRGTL